MGGDGPLRPAPRVATPNSSAGASRAQGAAWVGSPARACGTETPASRAGVKPCGAGSAVRAPGPDLSAGNQKGRSPLVRDTERGSHRLQPHLQEPRPPPRSQRPDPTMRRGAGRRRGMEGAGHGWAGPGGGGVTPRPTSFLRTRLPGTPTRRGCSSRPSSPAFCSCY